MKRLGIKEVEGFLNNKRLKNIADVYFLYSFSSKKSTFFFFLGSCFNSITFDCNCSQHCCRGPSACDPLTVFQPPSLSLWESGNPCGWMVECGEMYGKGWCQECMLPRYSKSFLFLFVSFGPTVLAQLHEHPFP